MLSDQLVVFSCGTYEEVIRVAPVFKNLQNRAAVYPKLVFQGSVEDVDQHERCCQDFGLPAVDAFLNMQMSFPRYQIVKTCEAFENYLLAQDQGVSGVVVCGESDGAMACALAAAKLGIRVASVDCDFRRNTEPQAYEEMNGVVMNQIVDRLLISELHNLDRLLKEEIPFDRIRYTGNALIDDLKTHSCR